MALLHRSELVPQVSGLLSMNFCLTFQYRCDAKPVNLDAPGARRRTDAKTAFLVTCFDPGTLWDDFGIRSDVIVSSICTFAASDQYSLIPLALHAGLSPCRYSRVNLPRSPASSH